MDCTTSPSEVSSLIKTSEEHNWDEEKQSCRANRYPSIDQPENQILTENTRNARLVGLRWTCICCPP
ncbi:hypothetical protein GDO81_013626 [Engystomops pustulosus]|uniref:Uncharacterized protein n=1 Tax=Engystomops pustulosus TaxID=76066 RepID=A0AAV7B210_ENGPU|nr:hypothetical protein GDO81_013626 [Engystomops pustulosus]